MSDKLPKSVPEKYGDIIAFGHNNIIKKGTYGADHLHGNTYKFNIITAGKGTFHINGVSQEVKEGDIHITFPFEHYKIEADKDCDLFYNYINLNVCDVVYSSKFACVWLSSQKKNIRIFHDEGIERIIESIVLEMNDSSRLYHDVVLSYLVNRFIISFTELFRKNTEKSSGDFELCCNTIGYIDSHFYEIKDVEAISKSFNYSHDYLSKVFKKYTGISIEEYHRVRKLELAKLLLSQKCLSVTDISSRRYYSGVQSFSKAFKNHWGYSPKEYVDRLKK